MRIRSVLKHSTMAVLEGALVASLVVGLMAGTALAGKGGGGNPGGAGTAGSTIALVIVSDANADGSLNWGDVVTFTVTSSAASPMVNLTCYQGGDWVTNQTVGFYPGWPWSQDFPLSSWKWTAGAADCTARLYTQTKRGTQTLATLGFSVGP